ncbi:PFAM Protein kinase domain [Fragilaria crotonensis]|nr:PFAM Protein kinase domain [Fragilaria crotonensis]
MNETAAEGRVRRNSRLSLTHCSEAVKLDVSSYQLYREEMQVLRDAWVRTRGGRGHEKAETILVHGNAASGKSAFVQSMRRPVEQSGGIFLAGAFSAESRSKQYAAISHPIVALYEKLKEVMGPNDLREYIAGELGVEEILTLTRCIPRLSDLLVQKAEPKSSQLMSLRSMASNRKNNLDGSSGSSIPPLGENGSGMTANARAAAYASLARHLGNLLKALARKSIPILFLVEDLHLATAPAVALFSSLINDRDISNILFVGTYAEDDTLFKETFFSDEYKANSMWTDLCLGAMSVHEVNQLVAAATDMPSTKTFDLASIVCKKAGGNIYLVTQFLELLQEQKLLLFSFKTNEWEWDIARIESETDVNDSVADIIVRRIHQLHESAQVLLKIASCLGLQFDLALVAVIIAHEDAVKVSLQDGAQSKPIFDSDTLILPSECVDSALEKDLEYLYDTGLVEHCSDGMSKFAHEKVQHASYALISAGPERDQLHLRIGRLLCELNEYDVSPKDWMVFAAVDQFNKVSECILFESDVMEVIHLNIAAAELAVNMSAFVVASAYLRAAVRLVERDGTDKFWKSDYRLCLRLYNDSAEMEQCTGKAENCLTSVNTIFKHAHNSNDMFRAYVVQIHVIASQGSLQDAIVLGLSVLKKLGVSIPDKPRRMQIIAETQKTKKMLKGRTDESLVSGLRLVDREHLMTLELLHLVSMYCHLLQERDLLSVVFLRSLQCSLQYGASEYTPCAFVNFGVILAASGEVDEGFRYAGLAMQMLDSVSDQSKAEVLFVLHAFLYHWKNPLRQSLDPLMKSYDIAMSTGSIEVALSSAGAYAVVYTCTGLPLSHVASDLRRYKQQSVDYSLDTVQTIMSPSLQFVLNLMGESRDDLILTGEAMNQDLLLQHATASGNRVAVRAVHRYRLLLATIFGDTRAALGIIASLPPDEATCRFEYVQEAFASALACTAHARADRGRKILRQAQTYVNVVLKWTKTGNVNCHDMLLLLEAEMMGIAPKYDVTKVRAAYDKAIASSSRSGYLHNAAIANEKAALFFADQGDTFWFYHYLEKAHEKYIEWNAWGKVRQLETRYPFLLQLDNDVASVRSGSLQGRTRFNHLSSSLHGRISSHSRRAGLMSTGRRSVTPRLEDVTSPSPDPTQYFDALDRHAGAQSPFQPVVSQDMGFRRRRSSLRSSLTMDKIDSDRNSSRSASASLSFNSDMFSSETDDEVDSFR